MAQGAVELISWGFGSLRLGSFRNFHSQDWRKDPQTTEHKNPGTEDLKYRLLAARAQRAQRIDSRNGNWNGEADDRHRRQLRETETGILNHRVTETQRGLKVSRNRRAEVERRVISAG
jgi:hypothetical protein